MRGQISHVRRERSFRDRFFAATLVTGALAAAIFLSAPHIDLAVVSKFSHLCTDAHREVRWCRGGLIPVLRYALMALFVLASLAAVAGLMKVVWDRRALLGAEQARWWFLAANLVIGPGLVANFVLKDHWGRARPRTLLEFGGERLFSPALVPVNECRQNCAFVSGEAASMFTIFFALAFVLPQYRRTMLAAGLITGLGAGVLRMLEGGHFPSDIVFAGVFMALTASALYLAILVPWQNGAVWAGADERLLAGRPLAILRVHQSARDDT